MLYLTADDFLEKVKAIPRISREEELDCARKMNEGDAAARQRLTDGYLPQVAAHIRRMPENLQSLELVMRCCRAVEKAVDGFRFEQEGETFTHRLSWWLRQETTRYIADR